MVWVIAGFSELFAQIRRRPHILSFDKAREATAGDAEQHAAETVADDVADVARFRALSEQHPDRIICGIGAWWEPLASKVGVRRERPLRAMREVITAVRGLLADETVTVEGTDERIEVVVIRTVWHPKPERRSAQIQLAEAHVEIDARWRSIQVTVLDDLDVMKIPNSPEIDPKALHDPGIVWIARPEAGQVIHDIRSNQVLVKTHFSHYGLLTGIEHQVQACLVSLQVCFHGAA